MYMSIRSQRINLLVTPEEKAAIEAAALAGDMSVSEHIRQAALVYEVDEPDMDEIKTLVKEVGEAAERMHKRLDKTLAANAKWKKEMAALRACR